MQTSTTDTKQVVFDVALAESMLKPGIVCTFKLDWNKKKLTLINNFHHTINESYSCDWNHFFEFIHNNDRTSLSETIEKSIALQQPFEISVRANLAEKIEWLTIYAQSENQMAYGAIINTSDRFKNTELLADRQKKLSNLIRVSSLSQMASMLSHELSQPLVVINTYIAGCIRRLENETVDKAQLIYAMKKANQNVERAGILIHNMKTLFRKGGLNYEKVDIHEIIKRAIALVEYERNSLPVSFVFDLDTSLPMLEVDRLQIKFVILSLIHNSIDAILESSENSQITIRTQSIDDSIEIQVIDFGCGISEPLKNKLFTTHCTTKPNGTGLTLIICRGIIEAHNGELISESYQNGTKFSFTLPIERP